MSIFYIRVNYQILLIIVVMTGIVFFINQIMDNEFITLLLL